MFYNIFKSETTIETKVNLKKSQFESEKNSG